jgi:hypothetical protein
MPTDRIPRFHERELGHRAWANSPAQVTDGHLLQLAIAHGAVLATLDERIPGALLIP